MTHRLSPIVRHEPFHPFIAWVDLILMASHADHLCGEVSVKRGQVLTSQMKLAERWRWDRKKVRKYLNKCAEFGEISIEWGPRDGPYRGPKWGLLTICNYDTYQRTSPDTPQILPTINKGEKGKKKEGVFQKKKKPESTAYPTDQNDFDIQQRLRKDQGSV